MRPAVPTVSRRPRRQTLAPRHRGPDRPQAAGPHPRRRPPPELLVPTRLAWRPALARAAGGRAREDPCAVLAEQEARAQRPEAGLKGHSCVRKEAVYSTSFSNGRTDRARGPNTQGGTRGRHTGPSPTAAGSVGTVDRAVAAAGQGKRGHVRGVTPAPHWGTGSEVGRGWAHTCTHVHDTQCQPRAPAAPAPPEMSRSRAPLGQAGPGPGGGEAGGPPWGARMSTPEAAALQVHDLHRV